MAARYKVFLSVLFIIQSVNLLLSISCGARTTGDDSRNGSHLSSSSPTPDTSAAQNSSSSTKIGEESPIRYIDFKNLTYPWYPSFLKHAQAREITLHDGKFEEERDEKRGLNNLALQLQNVTFADLSGKGNEQAIVTLGGISVFNRFVGAIFVYAAENGTPVLLWQQETGDRADGGLRRLAVEDRKVIVEQYVRSEGDGGLCCPRKFTRKYYQLNVDKLVQTRSELLPSGYDTAKFLGYPSQGPSEEPPK
jgi:hypothetical protein